MDIFKQLSLAGLVPVALRKTRLNCRKLIPAISAICSTDRA